MTDLFSATAFSFGLGMGTGTMLIALLMVAVAGALKKCRAASAIEARRAETHSDSVEDESAVGEAGTP